jgi:hypothetical protein
MGEQDEQNDRGNRMSDQHYSEAALLETYYMQPGESMPVMMHLASCGDCAAKYERLERKLREAAACSTEKPQTFWTRQRLQIMRKVAAHGASAEPVRRTLRIAAGAILAFLLGGALVYKSVQPELRPQTPASVAAAAPAIAAPADGRDADAAIAPDAWQSDELDDFRPVVQWESWVAETRASNGETSL